MSKIPYFFETPTPKYFRENGWFENENMYKFVNWAFARCQSIHHKEVVYGREITLSPFEFIAGRLTSPKECFLSENIFRNQINQLITAGILVKTPNSLTNKYTCYRWVTERFQINNNQQKNQQITNRQPTDNHKERIENIRIKETTTTPLPPKVVETSESEIVVVSFSDKNKFEQKPSKLEEPKQYRPAVVNLFEEMEKSFAERKLEKQPTKNETIVPQIHKSTSDNIDSGNSYKKPLHPKTKQDNSNHNSKNNKPIDDPLRTRIARELREIKFKEQYLSELFINNLMEKNTDEIIDQSIKCAIKDFKKIDTLEAFLTAACNGKWKPNKSKEEKEKDNELMVEKNKEIVREFNGKKNPLGIIQIDVLSKHVEFVPQIGQALPKIILFSENGFEDKFFNMARNYKFDINEFIQIKASNLACVASK